MAAPKVLGTGSFADGVNQAHAFKPGRMADRAPDGTLWLVRHNDDTDDYELYYSTDNADTWIENTNLNVDAGTVKSTAFDGMASLYIDENGSLHLVVGLDSTASTATNDEFHYFFVRDIAPATSSWDIQDQLVASTATYDLRVVDVTAHGSGTDTFVHIGFAEDAGATYEAYYLRFKITSGDTLTTDQSVLSAGTTQDDTYQLVQVMFRPSGTDPKIPDTDPDVFLAVGGNDGDNTEAWHLNATSGSTWATSFSAGVVIHNFFADYPLMVHDGGSLLYWPSHVDHNNEVRCHITNDSATFNAQNNYTLTTGVSNPQASGAFVDSAGDVYLLFANDNSPHNLSYVTVENGVGFGSITVLVDEIVDNIKNESTTFNFLNRGCLVYCPESYWDGAQNQPGAQTWYLLDNSVPTTTWNSSSKPANPIDDITIDWNFSDSDSDTQVRYELQFRDHGDYQVKWWNGSAVVTSETTVASASTSVTVPADSFEGPFTYRVRVFDGFEWSAWSAFVEVNVTSALFRGWGEVPIANPAADVEPDDSKVTPTATGYFTKNTATGTQAITGLGFEPNALLIYGVGAREVEVGVDVSNNTTQNVCVGMSSGPTESYCVVMDVEGNSDGGAMRTAIIAGLGSSAVVYEADLDSFDSDGFTLDWVTNNSDADIFVYFAMRVPEAKVVRYNVPENDGDQTLTGAGFTPSAALWSLSNCNTDETVNTDDAIDLSFGYSGNSPLEQGCNVWHFGATLGARQFYQGGEVLGVHHHTTATAIDYVAELEEYNSDGAVVKWSLNPNAGSSFMVMWIKDVMATVGAINAPNTGPPSPGDETDGLPFNRASGVISVDEQDDGLAGGSRAVANMWVGMSDLFNKPLSSCMNMKDNNYSLAEEFCFYVEGTTNDRQRMGVSYGAQQLVGEWTDYEAEGTANCREPRPFTIGPPFLAWDTLDDFEFISADDFDDEGQILNAVAIPDQRYMATLNNGSDTVQFYGITDLRPSTATVNGGVLDVTTQDSSPQALFVRPDGLWLCVGGSGGGGDVNSYTSSTAWQGNTFSHSANLDTSAYEGTVHGVDMSPDGLNLFHCGSTNDLVKWTLSSAWDLTSATHSQTQADLGIQTPVDMSFSRDGKTLLLLTNNHVIRFTLSTAWDLTTLTEHESYAHNLTTPRGLELSPDGNHFYVSVGVSGSRSVHHWRLK